MAIMVEENMIEENMTEYKTKTIMLGRGKKIAEGVYPLLISFFDKSDPHLKGTVPKKVIEYKDVEKVKLIGFTVDYMLAGNDLVINDLTTVKLEKKENLLIVSKK